MTKSTLHSLTGYEITNLIKNNELTAVEVAKAFVERTEKLQKTLQAFASVDYSYILEQASNLTHHKRKGSLIGIPIGIKDIYNTLFYPTQKGAFHWQGYKAGNDARCVSYLRDEDAIIFGKTDTAELAVHAGGKTINPYHPGHVTGSSSGGSAVAVATAMVPIALGSQTAGSLIRPASWCGVYAMKPSFGLISRTGVLKTTDTLDSMGFFTRSVDDLEIMLNAMRLKGDNFPIQESRLQHYASKNVKKKWKIAICSSHITNSTQSYVNETIQSYKQKLSQVDEIEVIELELPKITHACQALHNRLYYPCLAYYLKTEYITNPSKISDSLNQIINEASIIPPDDYGKALIEQTTLAESLENFFKEHEIDVILINSSNGSAPLAEEPQFHNDLNMLWTMSWLPVVNIPLFTDNHNMPYGMSLVGPRYSDYRIIQLLYKLEEWKLIPERSCIAEPVINSSKNEVLI